MVAIASGQRWREKGEEKGKVTWMIVSISSDQRVDELLGMCRDTERWNLGRHLIVLRGPFTTDHVVWPPHLFQKFDVPVLLSATGTKVPRGFAYVTNDVLREHAAGQFGREAAAT